MCGIAGIINFNSVPVQQQLLTSMNGAMKHRGPDGDGFFISKNVGLSHLRLAIIDLETGQQPMKSNDGVVTVVFNGEIYNFQEIRRKLEGYGAQFRTTSDTEVLIHAWQRWGTKMLAELNGMFAFALHDAKSNQVFIARDRLGVKPLYFSQIDNSFIFASELGGILASNLVSKEINPVGLDLYLHYQYIPAPHTIYNAVQKLRPAEWLLINTDSGKFTKNIYWNIPTHSHPNQSKKPAEWSEELNSLLDDAIKIRLISDVPFGAFLSGGADSGIVVAKMSQRLTHPVQTFSIGLENQKDELPYAKMVADKYKTAHTELKVSPEGLTLIPKLCPYFGEPFADSSAVPTYYVSKLAREKVKMVLTGDGGDEMFAGYTRYAYLEDAMRNGRIIRSTSPTTGTPIWKKIARKTRTLFPNSYAKVKQAAQSSEINLPPVSTDALPWYDVYDVSMSHFSLIERQALLQKTEGLSEANYFTHLTKYPKADSVVTLAQLNDIHSYLPGDILTKVDRMSMANSLEARSPLLDYRLAEFALTMPMSLKLPEPKLDGSKNKFILKELASEYLGRDYVYRPKEGFGIPVSQWLREDSAGYLHDTLSSNSPIYDLVDRKTCQNIIDLHMQNAGDYGAKIWNLLMLDGWFRNVHNK